MPAKTAHDFDQELLILFDAYVHGAIDRRTFLDKAARFAVGGVTAAMLLAELSPNFAAQVVGKDDARIKAESLEFDSPKGYGKARGYFVRPAGAKGKRFSLPNSRIVIHQPLMQGLAGQATDIDIHAREILRMRERLNEILVHHTGQPFKRIQEDTERDYIMSADQGKDYGIIDDVIRKRV